MNKTERRIFILYAEIAGLNTQIIFLKSSNDPKVVKLRKELRKKVGELEKKVPKLKK